MALRIYKNCQVVPQLAHKFKIEVYYSPKNLVWQIWFLFVAQERPLNTMSILLLFYLSIWINVDTYYLFYNFI